MTNISKSTGQVGVPCKATDKDVGHTQAKVKTGRKASLKVQKGQKELKSTKVEKMSKAQEIDNDVNVPCVETQVTENDIEDVKLEGSRAYVRVSGVQISALVDTGALQVSCLAHKAYQAYNFNSVSPIKDTKVSCVKGVGSHSVAVLGEVSLPVEIGPLTTTHRFLVLENMNCDMILGMDFVNAHVSVIDIENSRLRLRQTARYINLFQTPEYPMVHLISNITLPPRSEVLVPATIPHLGVQDLDHVLLTPVKSLSGQNTIAGAHTIANVEQGKTMFRMLNPTDTKIRLRKRQPIAEMARLADDDLPNSNDPVQDSPQVYETEVKSESSEIHTEEEYIGIARELGFTLEDSILNEEERRSLLILLGKNRDIFAKDLSELSTAKVQPHSIDTGNAHPVRQRPYRVNPDKKEEIDRQIKEMVAAKVISPSVSEWQSPVVLVKKKDKSFRFAVDYRKLNAVTRPITYPLPRVDDVFDAIGKAQAKYFSTLDLMSGFWQLPLDPASAHKTSFVTHSGVYQFLKLPFGLRNSPSAFAMAMSHVLRDLTFKQVIIYVDDILVMSETFQEHLDNLSLVFNRLREAQLRLKPSKCNFAAPKIGYLGHMITGKGVEMEKAKIQAVENFPRPHNLRTLRGFLGLANYYRRFVKGFSHIAKPLNQLTKAGVKYQWDDTCEEAFTALKAALTSDPVLAYPNFKKPFILHSDASDTSVGFILGQKDEDGRERAVAYGGKSLNSTQKNWDVRDKELFAIVEGIRHFDPYLSGDTPFTIYTDHKSLQHLQGLQPTTGRLARWLDFIQGYNYNITYKPGKSNTNADAMSRIEHPEEASEEKEEERWITSVTTDSQVREEYHLGYPAPSVSAVAVEHLTEEERQKMEDAFTEREPVTHIMEFGPASHQAVRELQEQDDEFGPLIRYLKHNELPDQAKDRDSVVLTSKYYTLGHQDILYHSPRQSAKPGTVPSLQLAVPQSLRDDLLKSFHDCIAGGGHQGTNRVYQAMREKYYWKSMIRDITCYVKSCLTCQQAKRKYGAKPAPLHPIPPGNIFSRMHIDIVGPLPKSDNGEKYILVVIDAFSRWCEAFPMKTMEAIEVAKYLYQDVICRYGAPDVLVSDRGQQFMSLLIKHLSKLFEITNHYTSSYHPQSNAMVERLNGTLVKTLKAYVSDHQKDWPDYLPSVLMAYRISPATESTHFSPYYLLFGKECRRPIDVALTPPEKLGGSIGEYVIKLGERKKITCELAKENILEHQEKYKQLHDKNAEKPSYRVGDRVWLYCTKTPVGKSPKLLKKWTGPYYIASRFDKYTYKLQRADDHRAVKSRIHANRLKLYFDPDERPTNPPKDLQAGIMDLNPEELEDLDPVAADNSAKDPDPAPVPAAEHQAAHPENSAAKQKKSERKQQKKPPKPQDQPDWSGLRYIPIEKIILCKLVQGVRWYKVQFKDKNFRQSKQLVREDCIEPEMRNKFHAEYNNNGKKKRQKKH